MVELAAAMVGDVDAVNAQFHAHSRIFCCGDSLQDQRNIVLVFEAFDVVPGIQCLIFHAARTDPPGLDESVIEIALAPTVMGRVDGNCESVVAIVDCAFDVVVFEIVAAANVELEDLRIVGCCCRLL